VGPAAIEVYPAATLRAHGAAERGYTQPGSEARSRGEATAPDDEALARREGWIWVRAPRIERA